MLGRRQIIVCAWINDIAGAMVGCAKDIIFVLDDYPVHHVLSDFSLMKGFVLSLVSRMDIDIGSTRVGVVAYETNIDVENYFNLNRFESLDHIERAISQLSRKEENIRTCDVLAFVRNTMLTSEAGDRSDVPNVVVVVTDGDPNDTGEAKVCTCTVWKDELPYFRNYIIIIISQSYLGRRASDFFGWGVKICEKTINVHFSKKMYVQCKMCSGAVFRRWGVFENFCAKSSLTVCKASFYRAMH